MSSAATAFISSSSSTLVVKNPSLSFASKNSGLLHGYVRSRVWFRRQVAPATSLRCFASAAGFEKVQVQNPIVEMDGKTSR